MAGKTIRLPLITPKICWLGTACNTPSPDSLIGLAQSVVIAPVELQGRTCVCSIGRESGRPHRHRSARRPERIGVGVRTGTARASDESKPYWHFINVELADPHDHAGERLIALKFRLHLIGDPRQPFSPGP